jgi:hypothetical protein
MRPRPLILPAPSALPRVGRKEERQTLAAVLEDARRHRDSTWLIEGEAGGSFGSTGWFFVEWLAVLGPMMLSVIAYGDLYGPNLNGGNGLLTSNAACGGGYAYQYNVASFTEYAVAELAVVGAFAGIVSLPSDANPAEDIISGIGFLVAGGAIYFAYSDLVYIAQLC